MAIHGTTTWYTRKEYLDVAFPPPITPSQLSEDDEISDPINPIEPSQSQRVRHRLQQGICSPSNFCQNSPLR